MNDLNKLKFSDEELANLREIAREKYFYVPSKAMEVFYWKTGLMDGVPRTSEEVAEIMQITLELVKYFHTKYFRPHHKRTKPLKDFLD